MPWLIATTRIRMMRNENLRPLADVTSSRALAGAGAAISLSSKIANAQQGEIGYWAKDLTNDN